jgi:ferredoxin
MEYRMKLSVDASLCVGHGQCYTVAPALLSDDDEGFVALRGHSMALADDQLPEARLAVAVCPERAVTLRSDA